jgi:hypothetical protein
MFDPAVSSIIEENAKRIEYVKSSHTCTFPTDIELVLELNQVEETEIWYYFVDHAVRLLASPATHISSH